MISNGLAERVADVNLLCSLGEPGGAVQGMLLLGLDAPLANRIDAQQQITGLTIGVVNGVGQTPLAGISTSESADRKNITIRDIATNLDASGSVTLRIGGLRVAAGTTVNAGIAFVGSPLLSISPQTVPVGYPVGSFDTTTPFSVLQPHSKGLTDLDPSKALAGMPPNMTARVTESDVSTFHAKLDSDSSGTRVIVQFPGLPDGSRVFAPDAIAGSDADAPTRSGLFSALPTPGGYVLSSPGKSLLLVRVKAAKADGSAGQFAWQPQAGVNQLSEVPISEADYPTGGDPYFVYEVADSAPIVETAEIPVYAFAGPTQSNARFVARAAVQLAPVSMATVTTATTPIPRYTAADVIAPDCVVLRDCTAKWVPELRLQSNSSSSHTLTTVSGSAQGFLVLTNTGGGVALWTASVDYGHGLGGWLRLGATSGFVDGQVNISYSVAPSWLRPGTYHANVVFTLTDAPDGATPTVSRQIEMILMPNPAIRR